MKLTAFVVAGLTTVALAFVPPTPRMQTSAVSRYQRATTTTMMASEEFNRMRAARKPGPLDRVVELQKPLGIVLEEDEKGNVYVKELSPAGNAARSGKVYKGDLVTMISATFGDEVWSARGAGLGMIMQAIKIRQGNTVKIVLEKSNKSAPAQKKPAASAFSAPKKPAVKPEDKAKKDAALLKQLEAEEKGKKKFFGLF